MREPQGRRAGLIPAFQQTQGPCETLMISQMFAYIAPGHAQQGQAFAPVGQVGRAETAFDDPKHGIATRDRAAEA